MLKPVTRFLSHSPTILIDHEVPMNAIDTKAVSVFPGKVVRKDLTKLVKGNAVVPTYVLEYLLGQYCSSEDEATIQAGVESVRDIIAKSFVHRDEAKLIQSTIKESEQHRVIDKLSAQLNPASGIYECAFSNLGISKVPLSSTIVKQHPKLLSGGGVWSIVSVSYFLPEDKKASPWVINNLKPIQLSACDLDEYKELRKKFTTDEWMDLLLQSMGLNPEEFDRRSKFLQLSRLIPFCENNYNLIELGPKGTGKSHIFSELSPHGILISGGEVTKAKLFVSNSSKRGEIGLIGYWDCIAYDEFAGKTKKVDTGLIDIMKNYMANKSFSRGTDVIGATASMAFVGNTDHLVEYMLKQSDLFDALSPAYRQSAFLDRFHAYLPGWEVKKLRHEMLTGGYGFIVDYLAEVLKSLRKEDFTNHLKQFFELSDTITTRDLDGIRKTYSGLLKVLYPHGECTETESQEMLEFAIESRMRVKLQLLKIDSTFEPVDFAYTIKQTGEKRTVTPLENVTYGLFHENAEAASSSQDSTESSPGDPEGPHAASDMHSLLRSFYGRKTAPGQIILRSNQKGVTYAGLFAPYLIGAKKIEITDPYIRFPYQIRNLVELVALVHELRKEGEEIQISLKTSTDAEFAEKVQTDLNTLADSLEGTGVSFSYSLDTAIHDRSIVLDNGWKIILGRGLDIWQKTIGMFDIAEKHQGLRLCKDCEITVLRN